MSTTELLNLSAEQTISSSVILFVESSDGDHWQRQICPTIEKLVKTNPGKIEKLFFLGNTKSYPVVGTEKIIELLSGVFKENENPVSLIGPLYEVLKENGINDEIAVICTELPVDIDDWQDTEMLERSLFITAHGTLPGENIRHIQNSMTASTIFSQLNNPVREVMMKGAGFAPLRWGIPDAMTGEVAFSDNGFCLRIPLNGERLDLYVQAICNDDAPPEKIACRTRGNINEKGAFTIEKKPWFEEECWQTTPEQLLPVIEAKRKREPFVCPQCKGKHDHNTLLCPEGGAILKGMPLETCLLFSKEKYLPLTGNLYAIPLQNNKKIITRDGEIFQIIDGRWQAERTITQFEEVDNDTWGVLTKI